MNDLNLLLAAPEIWVVVMTCVIMLIDLFLRDDRKAIVHMLAMITLVFAAIITMRGDYLSEGMTSALAFSGSFVRDEMGDVLKLFSYFVLGMVYIYSKFGLRQ